MSTAAALSHGRASTGGDPSPPPPPVPPMPAPLSARADRTQTSSEPATAATVPASPQPPSESAVSKLIGKYEVGTGVPRQSLSNSNSTPTPVHAPSSADRRGSTPVWTQPPTPQQQSPMQPLQLASTHSGSSNSSSRSDLHPPPALPLPTSPASPIGPTTPAFPFPALIQSQQPTVAAAASTSTPQLTQQQQPPAATASSTSPQITVMPPRASSGEESPTVLNGSGLNGTAAPRRPGPPPLPTMPSPRSPLSPTISRHHRQRTQDDAGVEEVEAYLRAPGQATGPVTPRRLASAAAAAVGTRRAQHTPNNASIDASSVAPAAPSPTASPGSTAAARHKLKSFRTLPLNLPSSSVLAAAAAYNQAMQEQEEEKTNDSAPRRSSGRPTLSILSPSSGASAAMISVRSVSPALSAASASPQPPSASASVSATAGAGSSSFVVSSTASSGGGLPAPGQSQVAGHGSKALSPTHFSYWEKRNIWVQREQEEMRAKVHLKKVLRKINQSNMIIAAATATSQKSVKLRSSWSAGTANTPAAAAVAATPPPLSGATGSPKPSPVSPSPSPPAFPLALVNGAAAVAAVRRDNAAGASPRQVSAAPTAALTKVSSPTASTGHALTITELTAAASTLNLTAHLGSTHAVKELTTHLTQMEQAECKFTSAPQIMWALKALTTTGTEEEPAAALGSNATDSAVASAAASRARPPKPTAPAPTSAREIAASKRASIERILSEQNFAPNVVKYIRSHTILGAPPPVPAMPLAHSRQTNAAGAAASPTPKARSPTAAAAAGATVSSTPAAASSTAVLAASPLSAGGPAAAASPAAISSLSPPVSSPGATFRRQTMPTFPSSSSGVPGASAAPSATSRSNSGAGATELDHEWSRRHIPKVKSFSQQGLSMRHRIDAKLREEEEELAEKRRNIVARMKSLAIWNDASAISEESILSSLGVHRFDLLRFTFELTELHEMAERNIRFDSAAQAMAALKVLYEKRSSSGGAQGHADIIPAHIMAYLEARRNEIMNSREEMASAAAAATAAAAAVAAAPGLMRSPGGSRSVVGGLGSGGAAGAHSLPGASPGPPPTPLSVASTAPAAPLSSAHHRAISLLELVEMLSSGNLLDDSASASAPQKKISPESLAWLLSDVGLDISEVSIDDLIQMQQHPSLVRSFATPKQIVCALQILYTHYDEQEVEEQAQRESLPPKVIQYLLQQQRASLMGVGAPGHPGNSVSVGDVGMLIDALSFQSTLSYPGDGRKRTRIQRAKRAKDMRAKIIEYELQSIDEELAFESIEEAEGASSSSASSAARPQPKYQSYELKISDRKVLAARCRPKAPLPSLPLPKLCAALNAIPACDGSDLIASECLPLSTADLAQLVVEMPLVLSEGDCEIDLADLEMMQAANAAAGGDPSKRLQFQTPKQCLMALQLLNVDCVSLAEFEASCARSNFSEPVVSFLQLHSRSMVAQRLLVDAAAHERPAAKCALLEFEIQKAEDLEEMEMEQMEVEDGRALVEFGAGATEGTAGGGGAAVAKSSFVSHELGFDSDGMGVGGEELEYSGRLSLADLSQRLQQSTLLSASSDPSGSSASTLAHLIVSMDLPLATIDPTLLASDLAMMEQQGGLKFKHARHLLQALVMLQEEGFEGAEGEDCFFESLEAQHFSPSVTTFLVQLHRSPARADRLAVIRARRNGRGGGKQAPPASSVMQSEIVEEGDDGDMVEEEVNSTPVPGQGGRAIPPAQALGADSKPLKESTGGADRDALDAALIQQHIRQSSHFKPNPEANKQPKEIPPAQEVESPPTAGCCSKGACVIQ